MTCEHCGKEVLWGDDFWTKTEIVIFCDALCLAVYLREILKTAI